MGLWDEGEVVGSSDASHLFFSGAPLPASQPPPLASSSSSSSSPPPSSSLCPHHSPLNGDGPPRRTPLLDLKLKMRIVGRGYVRAVELYKAHLSWYTVATHPEQHARTHVRTISQQRSIWADNIRHRLTDLILA